MTTKPETVDSTEDYEDRQQQRYNERNIRKWKRRKVGAMTDNEQAKAKAKISKWQKKQQKLMQDTGRYRKYEREQIKTAR